MPAAATMSRLSEYEEGLQRFEEGSLRVSAEKNTNRAMPDLIPDQLGIADTFSTFNLLPSPEEKRDLVCLNKFPEEKRDLEVCNPFCAASDGEVTKSTVAVKRGFCQLPNLDLSLLPPPEPMGTSSFPYQHRGQPVSSAQRSPMAGAEQPPCAQLTIFYAGTVNVYNVSAEKARAIIMLASRISGCRDSATPIFSLSTPSTQLNSTPRDIDAAPLISSPSPVAILGHTPSSETIKSAALQISRRCCIQRFLEKRNERIHGKSPYLPPAQK